jgi:outer membrane protein
VGLGVNYTLIYGSDLSVAHIPLSLDPDSIGISGQVGCDFNLGHGTFFNLDVKKVELASGVYVPGGTQLTTAHLNPWLLSAGLGWRF